MRRNFELAVPFLRPLIISFVFLIILFQLVMLIPTLKPIKVFSTYYVCRVVEVFGMGVECSTLPTVKVMPPVKTDAITLGVEEPRELEIFFNNYTLPGHVYAHRTNSEQRARVYSKYYSAFEIDAVWDGEKGVLDIFHWPEYQSINFHFNQLLESVPKGSKIWVDLKNLGPANADDVRLYLNDQLAVSGGFSKQDIIIEAKNPHALAMMTGSGYKTSYYLPAHAEIVGCEDNQLTVDVIQHIQSMPLDYISFPYTQQKYVDQCIIPQTGDIAQLSWGGLPFAIPDGALERYKAYIVDHSVVLKDAI
ncbi:hypothetical protein NF212_08685 [Parasalinivibrio latis]|uniref:hypothetical protein n=1 Tax=Parasalinivibrio latis TaxID=2952610 RepID=UPI0030DE7CE3